MDGLSQWFHKNIDSSDLLAVIVLVITAFLAYHGIGGEDLPKYVIGGIIGYISKTRSNT
jgi:hypothetical protein